MPMEVQDYNGAIKQEVFILDTGTGADVKKSGGIGLRSDATDLCRVHTAGGVIAPSSKVQLGIEALGEDIECLELEHTLNALTMGRRCHKFGYSFTWRPWAEVPEVLLPDGTELDVFAEDYVPMISSSTTLPGVNGHERVVSVFPAVAAAANNGDWDDWYNIAPDMDADMSEIGLVDEDADAVVTEGQSIVRGLERVLEGGALEHDGGVPVAEFVEKELKDDIHQNFKESNGKALGIEHFILHMPRDVKRCRTCYLANAMKSHSRRTRQAREAFWSFRPSRSY